MKLSILICSLPEPYYSTKLDRLLSLLKSQAVGKSVEIIVDDAGRQMPTGTKRNNLISRASGEYVVFVDSDDLVSDSYINDILRSLESSPDCVTMRGWMTTNGINRREWTIKLGSGYYEKDGHYYRWPNHLAVMKKALIQSIPFPPIWQQEDYQWSKQINDKKILKTEVHIDRPIYHYDYWDKDKRHNHQTIKNIRR